MSGAHIGFPGEGPLSLGVRLQSQVIISCRNFLSFLCRCAAPKPLQRETGEFGCAHQTPCRRFWPSGQHLSLKVSRQSGCCGKRLLGLLMSAAGTSCWLSRLEGSIRRAASRRAKHPRAKCPVTMPVPSTGHSVQIFCFLFGWGSSPAVVNWLVGCSQTHSANVWPQRC